MAIMAEETTKEILLKDLKTDLALEEEITLKLSSFYAVLKWQEAILPEHHATVIQSLTTLADETKKHAQMIVDMIKYVEKSENNEF